MSLSWECKWTSTSVLQKYFSHLTYISYLPQRHLLYRDLGPGPAAMGLVPKLERKNRASERLAHLEINLSKLSNDQSLTRRNLSASNVQLKDVHERFPRTDHIDMMNRTDQSASSLRRLGVQEKKLAENVTIRCKNVEN